MRSFNVLFSLIVLVSAASAFSDNNNNQPQSQGGGQGSGQNGQSGMTRQGPPPEALEACQSKSVGTACTFTGRRGESLTGTCMTPDSSKPVACCPTNGPRGGGQPPNGGGQQPGGSNSQSSGSNQNQRQN